MTDVQEFLDSRSPLRIKLDEIRSSGHIEHKIELASRERPIALSHRRFDYDCDDGGLLRPGPWYMSLEEIRYNARNGETRI